MRAIIRPVSNFMQRLKYPQKFLLIALVIAIPFVVVFAFLHAQLNDSLSTLQQEKAGIAYLRPTRQFLASVSQAEVQASSYAKGNMAAKPTLMSALAQADGNLAALAAADQRYGGALKTTQSFNEIQTEWAGVRDGSLSRSVNDNNAAYDKLVGDLHELFESTGNNSLLVIDSQLDSTHLTVALLDRLPGGEDLLRQIWLQGQDLPYGQQLSPIARVSYQALTDQLTANVQATQDSYDNAFGATKDKNLRPALGANVDDYASSGKTVLGILGNQVVNPPTITVTPAAYNGAIMQTWNLNDQLWDRSSSQLDTILQARIEDVTGRDRLAQVLPLLAALVALYLLVGLYSGLMHTIRALGVAAQRMTGGEVDPTVTIDTRDEMGNVVSSFNAIAVRLRAEWVQARAESDRATAAEAKLRSIVDTALDGIVTIDAEGCVSGWNPQAEAIFGWSAAEVIGKPAAVLIATSTRDAFSARVETVLQTGVRQDTDNRMEIEAVRRDGSLFPSDVAISSLQRRDNAFSLFVRDITERKRMRDQEIEYLRNVALVTDAAAAVEVGTFDAQRLESLNSVAARDDGLGNLARVFQRMAREVAVREQQLKQQVQELRIEIDHRRAARQVAEITETDYFRQLKAQAASMRRKPE